MQPIVAWIAAHSGGCPGPPGDCPPWIALAYHLANMAISAADFAIPFIILANWKYRKEGVTRAAVGAVLVYFPVKAASRFLRAYNPIGPAYHPLVAADVLTSVLAVYATLQVGPFLRYVMGTRGKVHELNNRLHVELLEKEAQRLEIEQRNRRLLAEIEAAHRALASNVWVAEKHAALDRIAGIIKEGG